MAADPAERPVRGGADLLAHVEADLVGCALLRRCATRGVVVPASGPAFEVEVRRERRRLIDLQVLAVHVHGPPTDSSGGVVLHHTGQLRRTGLATTLRGNDPRAAVLRDALLADGQLARVSRSLDFTSFRVRPHAGAWRATLELMGASHVRTVLPPTSHYVRLGADQLAALLSTVAVLHARLPGRDLGAVRTDEVGVGGRSHASDHLPRSQR